MRRLFVLPCLAALLVLPTASTASDRLPTGDRPGERPFSSDGTLSVRKGRGVVAFSSLRGAVIGKIAKGSIRVVDPYFDDGSGPILSGCEKRGDVNDTTTVCSGTDIRFRAIDGLYRIRIQGSGIWLSAVGRGRVMLDGAGDPDLGIFRDGGYSLNGDPYVSLPDYVEWFPLSTPTGG